jgi:hypothetical protein
MHARLALGTVCVVFGALLGVGCSGGTTPARSTAASLIVTRCVPCHPEDRIKAAKHDEAGWKATVTRMRTSRGARLTDAEAEQVIEFLASGGESGE